MTAKTTLTVDQALQEAATHHQAERWAEAEWFYRAILQARPDHADANHLLGLIAYRTGRLEFAAVLIRKAISASPGMAAFHSNLGTVLHEHGKPSEAVLSYRRALVIAPDYPEALGNLGNALKDLGRQNEAVTCYGRALVLNSNFAEALSNLGNPLCDQGRLDDAAACCRRALVLKPAFSQAHYNLGNVLRGQGRADQAIASYQRALILKVDYAEAFANLGIALRDEGRESEAAIRCQQAVVLKADYPEAYCNLGIFWTEMGRLAKARRALECAVTLAPRRASAYRNLAQSKRFTAGDRFLAAMEELARDMAALDMGDQAELHFALGKAYEDLGRREQSFQHFLAGNACKRRLIAYDEAATLGVGERTRAVFTPALMAGKSGLGEPSEVPVFIFGMPRSGTSLVEQILASHRQVFGAGERPEFGRLAVGLGRAGGAGFPEAVDSLSAAALRRLGGDYLAAVRPLAPAAARITDKMPANFRFAGLIHLALPKARLIHCRRDPVDTCLSCFSKLFEGDLPWAYDLGEMGRYYRAYERLMAHWRTVLPPGVMLEVEYEELVADLEGQARRLVAHCGLDWDESCLAFHQTDRTVRTASATQVRRPIYNTSVGRWRPLTEQLWPLLNALGLP